MEDDSAPLLVSKDQLLRAHEGILSQEESLQVWCRLRETAHASSQTSSGSKVLYYFGGLLVIVSFACLQAVFWQRPEFLLVISISFEAVLFVLAGKVWRQPGLQIPGGLLYTAVVFLIPVAVFSAQRCLWGHIRGPFTDYTDAADFLEHSCFLCYFMSTVLGLWLLRSIVFPFLVVPVALNFYLLVADSAWHLGCRDQHFGYVYHCQTHISEAFGLMAMVAAINFDGHPQDLAFWLYLIGLTIFYPALTMDIFSCGGFQFACPEWSWWTFCAFNIALMVLSVLLDRTVFIVFGFCGVTTFLMHLFDDVFPRSNLFPFMVAMTGLGVMACGHVLNKNGDKLRSWASRSFPRFLPRRRAADDYGELAGFETVPEASATRPGR